MTLSYSCSKQRRNNKDKKLKAFEAKEKNLKTLVAIRQSTFPHLNITDIRLFTDGQSREVHVGGDVYQTKIQMIKTNEFRAIISFDSTSSVHYISSLTFYKINSSCKKGWHITWFNKDFIRSARLYQSNWRIPIEEHKWRLSEAGNMILSKSVYWQYNSDYGLELHSKLTREKSITKDTSQSSRKWITKPNTSNDVFTFIDDSVILNSLNLYVQKAKEIFANPRLDEVINRSIS